ncbi:MAG: electron transfer flavoprotein subunit beta/FixA family protein [Dehalococcoidia bacterium]|nr:electron transfer flavoprotein subunit beta/FixA family protein [Dehalococcoidia bacterium]
MPVNMIVCCKQVPDPEAPPTVFRVTNNKMTVPPDIKPVIGQYEEFALEAALKIKDTVGGKITALSLGNNFVRDVIKKTLAVGSDELILLEDEAFEDGDSWSTANALAMAIKKIGEYDIIFCGRQSSDWDAGQVGLGIAEILGIPAVTLARKVEITNGKAKVEQVIPDGYRSVEVTLPALITVTSELGALRYATLKGIMAAGKKQPVVWKPADIGLEPSQVGAAGRHSKLDKLFQPVKEAKCEIISGETPAEAGANLAVRLKEAKLL